MKTFEVITVIVEDTKQAIKKEYLAQQIDSLKDILNDNVLALPVWITRKEYAFLEHYLVTKDITMIGKEVKDTALLIKLLRVSDYLNMSSFQQQLITDIIIPSLNDTNCISFIEQTHKKLRNSEQGSQCWYNLLVASINHLSNNICAIYQRDKQAILRLHEKIINEVLDRAVRLVPKDATAQRDILFQVIMESKKLKNVDQLCAGFRQKIESKKINPTIHPKLSWKLNDVSKMNEKNTKNFKFLDLQWYLEAKRDARGLQVRLYLSPLNGQDIELGVFYVKVLWTYPQLLLLDSQATANSDKEVKIVRKETKTTIHYIRLHSSQEMPLLTIDREQQQRIGSAKVELSMLCSMEQVYTFVMNYITSKYDNVEINDKKMSPNELLALVALSKDLKKYSQALRITKYLVAILPDLPADIYDGYPKNELSIYQVDFLNNHQQVIPPELRRQSEQFPVQNKKTVITRGSHDARMMSPKPAANMQMIAPSVKHSLDKSDRMGRATTKVTTIFNKIPPNDSRGVKKIEQRQQSRGRLYKVFAASPSRMNWQNQMRETINQVTDLRRYLKDPNLMLFI